jgi:hypothetical protein
MKKGFYVFAITSLVLSFLLLESLAYGATIKGARVKEPQYGGTLTYLDRAPAINALSWDIK